MYAMTLRTPGQPLEHEEFLALAPRVPVQTKVETFSLTEANEAPRRLRASELRGAAVLVPQ